RAGSAPAPPAALPRPRRQRRQAHRRLRGARRRCERRRQTIRRDDRARGVPQIRRPSAGRHRPGREGHRAEREGRHRDPSPPAPGRKELGRAQAMTKKNKEALETLNRALAVAGPDPSSRADIYDVITDVYRAEQQLPILVKKLEDEHPTDLPRLQPLGSLYEET